MQAVNPLERYETVRAFDVMHRQHDRVLRPKRELQAVRRASGHQTDSAFTIRDRKTSARHALHTWANTLSVANYQGQSS